jgi:hypothetical protein
MIRECEREPNRDRRRAIEHRAIALQTLVQSPLNRPAYASANDFWSSSYALGHFFRARMNRSPVARSVLRGNEARVVSEVFAVVA